MQTFKTVKAGKKRAAVFISAALVFFSLASLFIYTSRRIHNFSPVPVSEGGLATARTVFFNSTGNSFYPFADAPDLFPFPSADIFSGKINARSAILVDATTGAVLFEKNADEIIPPASMTKLVAMFTAFHAAENGEISFDDIVALPGESWAANIPPGSSLMFLAEGQKVTVRELLKGMAVVSGNDAAIALAFHVSGSVEAFIDRMNGEMEKLGLSKTRFVEPSGLSGFNATTAREFADFALRYIREYPEALRAFHSQKRLEYPMPWNLGDTENITTKGVQDHSGKSIIQNATNRLLGTLEGCDGLKTGFISESGYNLSLTAERNGNRYISVTMGGPGEGSYEGNLLRNEDGTSLMEWAFENFRTVKPAEIQAVSIPVWGGTETGLSCIPALSPYFTAPAEFPLSADGNFPLEMKVTVPEWITAPVSAGSIIGMVSYSVEGQQVHSVPLIADRSIAEAGIISRLVDSAARLVAPLVN